MTFKRVLMMLLCLLSLTAGAEAQVCEPLASGEMVGQVVEILTGNFANWTKSDVTVSYPGQPSKFYEKTPEAMKKVQTRSLVCVPDSLVRPIQRASFAEGKASVPIVPVVVVKPIERPASQVDALGYVGDNSNPQAARSNFMFHRPGWMTMKTSNVQPSAPNFGSILAATTPLRSSGWLTLKASFSQLSAPNFGSMLVAIKPSSINWPFVLLSVAAMLLLLRGVMWYRHRPKPQVGNMTINLLPSPVEAPTSPPITLETDWFAPVEQATEVIPDFSWTHANSLADDSDNWIEQFMSGVSKSAAA